MSLQFFFKFLEIDVGNATLFSLLKIKFLFESVKWKMKTRIKLTIYIFTVINSNFP